jgi:ribosomal protein S3
LHRATAKKGYSDHLCSPAGLVIGKRGSVDKCVKNSRLSRQDVQIVFQWLAGIDAYLVAENNAAVGRKISSLRAMKSDTSTMRLGAEGKIAYSGRLGRR